MNSRSWFWPDLAACRRFAAALAATLPDEFCHIALRGELGAGKTQLVRDLLRAMGETGAVRSPTYTLLEIYELSRRRICHMDLYRLHDAQELEFLGLRELLQSDVCLLVEWPERGAGFLPAADVTLSLRIDGPESRQLVASAGTALGVSVLSALSATLQFALPCA